MAISLVKIIVIVGKLAAELPANFCLPRGRASPCGLLFTAHFPVPELERPTHFSTGCIVIPGTICPKGIVIGHTFCKKSTVVIRGTISGRDSDRIFWVIVIHGTICNFSGPLRGCCSAHILKRAIRLPGKDGLLFTAHFAGFFSFRVLLCSAQFPFCRILCAAFPAISFLNTAFLRHFSVVIHGTICKNPVFIVVIRGTFPGKNSSASPGCYLQHNSAISKGPSCYVRHISSNPKILFFELLSGAHFLLQDFFPAEL